MANSCASTEVDFHTGFTLLKPKASQIRYALCNQDRPVNQKLISVVLILIIIVRPTPR